MYTIQTTKQIGGDFVHVPSYTYDTEQEARAAFDRMTQDTQKEMDRPEIALVGADVSIFLGSDDGGMTCARVKRLVKSKWAQVWIDGKRVDDHPY